MPDDPDLCLTLFDIMIYFSNFFYVFVSYLSVRDVRRSVWMGLSVRLSVWTLRSSFGLWDVGRCDRRSMLDSFPVEDLVVRVRECAPVYLWLSASVWIEYSLLRVSFQFVRGRLVSLSYHLRIPLPWALPTSVVVFLPSISPFLPPSFIAIYKKHFCLLRVSACLSSIIFLRIYAL